MNYTKKEYDILLYLRKKPRKMKRLKKKFKPASDGVWNIWLSQLSELLYLLPEGTKTLEAETVSLNEVGVTVAQAERDRRFDMYFTRAMALAGLLASLFAIGVDVVQSMQGSPEPQRQCTTTYCECNHKCDNNCLHP